MQLPVILRNNLNPVITKLYAKSNNPLLQKVLVRNRNVFYKFIFVLGLISILLFPLIPYLLKIEHIFSTSILYAILCGGFILSGGYQPFLMIFNQLGKPKLQTWYVFLIFITNVILNLLFVPLIGIYGAALGTACSFLVQILCLKYLLIKHFKIQI
jgi:O-antigen/teichoic acid export membrane protein